MRRRWEETAVGSGDHRAKARGGDTAARGLFPAHVIPLLEKRSSSTAGFSLVEILIVVSLIALLMSFAIINSGGVFRVTMNTSSRELAATIRAAHDEAVLKGNVYRLVFDIDKNTYWVEMGDREFLLRSEAQEEEEKKRRERLTQEEREQLKDPFALARAVTKKKISLPTGVQFTEIRLPRFKEPLKGGLAHVYVFPHGFTESAVIHLKDRMDRELTLAINPVTGKTRFLPGNVKEVN